ncbi:MAG: CPBP family intramembrane metalloprotease [Alphaproteobacteria bacterium]|nr:CPBP family intramembrane metalloprotease [Alphaproteobacteria bacterium]
MKPTEIFAEPPQGWVPWAWLAPFLGIAFIAASSIGIELQLEAQGLLGPQGEPVGREGFIAFLLLPFLAMGLVVVGWTVLIERRSLAAIGLTEAGAGPKFAVGLLVGVITSGFVVAGIWHLGGYAPAGFAFADADALLYIAVLLACFAVQSSAEEILFRGWMLSAIARRWNVAGAVVIVSAVFTLLHLQPGQPLSMANTVLFSVFACCWALRSRHIWGVMGWHAAWNWFIGVGFEIPITGLDLQVPALVAKLVPQGAEYLTGGADGPEGSIVCSVLFIVASAFLIARGSTPR